METRLRIKSTMFQTILAMGDSAIGKAGMYMYNGEKIQASIYSLRLIKNADESRKIVMTLKSMQVEPKILRDKKGELQYGVIHRTLQEYKN